jgi:MFS family permease
VTSFKPKKWFLLPPGAAPEVRLVFWVRGLRAFGDGYVSLILPFYLSILGLDPFFVGLIATASLLGSGVITLGVGLVANRFRLRSLLLAATVMTVATGAGYAVFTDFWPLLIIAIIGTLNPAMGHSAMYLPLEHTLLASTVDDRNRTPIFARYSLIGTFLAALGSLAAGAPQALVAATSLDMKAALQAMFWLYGAIGLLTVLIYRRIPPGSAPVREKRPPPLTRSRRIVFKLAALFSLDSLGGGFVVQSLVALWLFQRFGFQPAAVGTIFFWVTLLGALSQLVAGPIARRIGLVKTMVFTHLPGNLLLIAVPFMPTAGLAVALLMARAALNQIDVPARNSYVMAVVRREERPAAMSFTTVPRGLAAAVGPLVAGYLLSVSGFGWPLVIGGGLMSLYDLLLLKMFHAVRPPEEKTDDPDRIGS